MRAKTSRLGPWFVAASALLIAVGLVALLIRSNDAETDRSDVAPSTGDEVTSPTAATTTAPPPATSSTSTNDAMASSATTSTTSSATTGPVAESITRPIVGGGGCDVRSARDNRATGTSTLPFVFFARPSSEPVPIQIIGDSVGGAAAPFALLQRLNRDPSMGHVQEQVDINGTLTTVNTFDNGTGGPGNGEAIWILPDGSEGYLRSRGLDRDDLVSLLERLSPRDVGVAIPGFDVASEVAGDSLELLHEQMNTGISGTAHLTQCRAPTTDLVYRISALDGDPVFEFGGVIDRSPPLEVGYKDGTLITITGPADPSAPTVADIINADPDDWLEFRSHPEELLADQGARAEATWIGRDLVFELFPVDPASAAERSYVTVRLTETQGVTNIEYENEHVTLAPDAAFWMLEINGRPRLKTTARVGSLTGSRLDDSVAAEPFTFRLSVEDLGGFTLQSTGEIELLLQRGS